MGSEKFAKLVIGVASAVAIATGAYAADAVVYEQPPEPVIIEPGFTWTGLYIGANVGYSWGDFDQSFDADTFLGPLSFDFGADADGIIGGAQIGYNWQLDRFVFGIEADLQAADLDATGTQSFNLFPIGLDTQVSTSLDWFATTRLRAGFVPSERLLVYGTGGFAFGRTTSTASYTVRPFVGPSFGDSVSESTTRTGWTAGGGAEYAFTDNWTFKTEYLYTDLGGQDFANFSEPNVFDAALSSDVKFHTVRVGVNYKF